MIGKKINLKQSFFILLLMHSPISLGQGSELGEDLKGECIATLPDQNRSELSGIKLDLDESSEEAPSGTTETKSK
tara:strand:+ start:268 stop:492 length:225 start_codon:yes stop_codon:yes gene_type:complete